MIPDVVGLVKRSTLDHHLSHFFLFFFFSLHGLFRRHARFANQMDTQTHYVLTIMANFMASNGTLFPKNIFFFSFVLVFLSAYFSFLLNVSFCFSFLNLLSYLFLSHTPLLALIMSFSFHFYNFSFFSLFLMFASTNSFCPQFCFIPSPMSSLFCLFFSFCFSFPFSNRVKVPCFSFFPIPFI